MKERARLSSGNMLLLELLFALIFFGLTLSVTLSVFGEAYALSRKAEGINLAVSESNDAAEIIRAGESVSEIEEGLLLKGLAKDAEGIYSMSYGDGRYNMKVDTSISGRLYTADVSCYDTSGADGGAEPLYSLTVEHAIKGGTEDGR